MKPVFPQTVRLLIVGNEEYREVDSRAQGKRLAALSVTVAKTISLILLTLP